MIDGLMRKILAIRDKDMVVSHIEDQFFKWSLESKFRYVFFNVNYFVLMREIPDEVLCFEHLFLFLITLKI